MPNTQKQGYTQGTLKNPIYGAPLQATSQICAHDSHGNTACWCNDIAGGLVHLVDPTGPGGFPGGVKGNDTPYTFPLAAHTAVHLCAGDWAGLRSACATAGQSQVSKTGMNRVIFQRVYST